LSRGDHLWVPRTLYRHHGVDIGNGRVVNYLGDKKRSGAICITPIEEFTDGKTLHIVSYLTRLPVEESIHRARSRVGEDSYDLVEKNCEHFASWCATGLHNSRQVRNVTELYLRIVPVPIIGPVRPILSFLEKRSRQQKQAFYDAPQWCAVCQTTHGWPDPTGSSSSGGESLWHLDN
jgi:hypothetical protein